MTFSALVSGWLGLTLSDISPDSDLCVATQHYEEDEHYEHAEDCEGAEDGEGPDDDSEVEWPPSGEQHQRDGYFRPSRLFSASYEEEADHLREANEPRIQSDDVEE
jgi:hypothetical protein